MYIYNRHLVILHHNRVTAESAPIPSNFVALGQHLDKIQVHIHCAAIVAPNDRSAMVLGARPFDLDYLNYQSIVALPVPT